MPVVEAVERGEILVREELTATACQETVEGLPANIVEIKLIGLEEPSF